jgi:hypothetical protein
MASKKTEIQAIRDSIEALCEAVRLLAVVAKSPGYESKDAEGVEQLTRNAERVSNLAERALEVIGGTGQVSDITRDQGEWLEGKTD